MVLEILRSLRAGRALSSFIEKKMPGTCPNLVQAFDEIIAAADRSPVVIRERAKELLATLQGIWDSVKGHFSNDDINEVIVVLETVPETSVDDITDNDIAEFSNALDNMPDSYPNISDEDMTSYLDNYDYMFDDSNPLELSTNITLPPDIEIDTSDTTETDTDIYIDDDTEIDVNAPEIDVDVPEIDIGNTDIDIPEVDGEIVDSVIDSIGDWMKIIFG